MGNCVIINAGSLGLFPKKVLFEVTEALTFDHQISNQFILDVCAKCEEILSRRSQAATPEAEKRSQCGRKTTAVL